MNDSPSGPKDWEAEQDARALMKANAIQSDPKRLGKAKKALKKIEDDAARTQLEAKVASKLKKLSK